MTSDLNHLVLDYLIVEGYKEAAEKFSSECGIETSIDMGSIDDRMAARLAIQNGDVQSAIERTNDLNPLILDNNPELFFHLNQQKLIELIRRGAIDEAIDFAQEELAPRGEEKPEFLAELERTLALLAFTDQSCSPVASLLLPSQRQKTASELNAAILSSQGQRTIPKLPRSIALLLWAENASSPPESFPKMDLETGSLSDLH
mmetsp:Transcript_9585/g.19606  ORF Transcript_9585/g.19606 Transcript_9585/m.19606 type:complete len:203 (+) Transcript_9585:353-961(+)